MRLRYVAVNVLALLAGCVGLSRTDSRERRAPATTPLRDRDQVGVVVVAVIDQLGSSTLERLMPLLDEDGAIRTLAARGAWYRRASYPQAATYTAPGHAILHTGASPSESGILANERWDGSRGEVPWIDDAASPVLGNPKATASPRALRVSTIADALRESSNGRAKIVSISIKDRAAVIGGGQRADVVSWYDSTLHAFTTSAFYGDLPSCIRDRAARVPLTSLLVPWELGDPVELAAWGPDAAPGEGHWKGWTSTFPHDPRASDAPWSVLRATPALTEYSVELAGECAASVGMGNDDIPDLIALSLSGTDYAGHVFGPASLEYADVLIRSDRALGRLLRALEARTSVAFVVTADHGVTPIPEQRQALGEPGGRIFTAELVAKVESALDRELGRGPWLSAFVPPFVTLAPRARGERGRVVPALIRTLASLPGVFAAFDVRDAAKLRKSADAVERAVGLSVDDDSPGEVFVVPAPGWVVDPELAVGEGTSHGSPWVWDREVPLLLSGPCVGHFSKSEPVDARRIAPTVTALARVPPPNGASLTALRSGCR